MFKFSSPYVYFQSASIFAILAFILGSIGSTGFAFGFCIGSVASNLGLLVLSLID